MNNSKRSSQKNTVGGSRKRLKQEAAFVSFDKGSRVLYATSLHEYADNPVPVMHLAPAKVLECEKRKGDKEPHVRLEKDDLSFWVPYSAIYEILLDNKDPHSSLIYLSEDNTKQCEGVRLCHFKNPTTRKNFIRLCEYACNERARLDSAACTAQGSILLSWYIMGITSFTNAKGGRLHSHFIRHGSESTITDGAFHHIGCCAQPTQIKPRRAVTTGAHSPARCDNCQLLRQKIHNVCRKERTWTTNNIAGSICHSVNNMVMTDREIYEKMKEQAQIIKSVRGQKLYYQQQRDLVLRLLVQKESDAIEISPAKIFKLGTEQYNNIIEQQKIVFDHVLDQNLAEQYFEKHCRPYKDAALAMLEQQKVKIKHYLKNGTTRGIKYNPVAFAMAVKIFMSMSRKSYDQLAQLNPALPTSRYIGKVIHKNKHQAGNIRRASIRQHAHGMFYSPKLSDEDKYAASFGNLSFDAMTIQEGEHNPPNSMSYTSVDYNTDLYIYNTEKRGGYIRIITQSKI